MHSYIVRLESAWHQVSSYEGVGYPIWTFLFFLFQEPGDRLLRSQLHVPRGQRRRHHGTQGHRTMQLVSSIPEKRHFSFLFLEPAFHFLQELQPPAPLFWFLPGKSWLHARLVFHPWKIAVVPLRIWSGWPIRAILFSPLFLFRREIPNQPYDKISGQPLPLPVLWKNAVKFKKMRKIPFDCKSGGGLCKPFDIHETIDCFPRSIGRRRPWPCWINPMFLSFSFFTAKPLTSLRGRTTKWPLWGRGCRTTSWRDHGWRRRRSAPGCDSIN